MLLAADGKGTSAHARAYYGAAVEIAFAVAAIDLHTSEDELEAIERFRGPLLAAIEHMEATRAAPAGATATVTTGATTTGAPSGPSAPPAPMPRRAPSTSSSPSSMPSSASRA